MKVWKVVFWKPLSGKQTWPKYWSWNINDQEGQTVISWKGDKEGEKNKGPLKTNWTTTGDMRHTNRKMIWQYFKKHSGMLFFDVGRHCKCYSMDMSVSHMLSSAPHKLFLLFS
jgi:hypothetical protein